MTIYSIRLSEDGLIVPMFTNIKALYDGILAQEYAPKNISMWIKDEKGGGEVVDMKFTYANLVKALRKNSNGGTNYSYCDIDCDGGCTISVNEHAVVTKASNFYK